MENLETVNEITVGEGSKKGALLIGGIVLTGITALGVLVTKIIKKKRANKKIAKIDEVMSDEEIFEDIDEKI